MLGKFHISVTKVAKIMDCRMTEWQKKKTKKDAVYFQAEDNHEQE